jgi:molybdate transport system substrate-binding protein
VKRAAALVAAGVALASGCGDGGSTRLVVSAAASMQGPLTACAPGFDRAQDADLKLSFAGSDQLAAQIRQGARVDVYAAANAGLPDRLHREGLLGAPVRFATNRLVLAVPEGSSMRSIQDLVEPATKLVIGSASVPIGAYTRETLARLPRPEARAILANVRSNEPDVKGIVGKLAQGAADAGFVYVTDVDAANGKLRAIDLPDTLAPRVTYAAGVVNRAARPELARRFVSGLARGGCAEALKAAGFGPAP